MVARVKTIPHFFLISRYTETGLSHVSAAALALLGPTLPGKRPLRCMLIGFASECGLSHVSTRVLPLLSLPFLENGHRAACKLVA